MTTEAWFYHLERSRLEDALPPLLEKAVARGLRALVKSGAPERLPSLDAHLWTYRDDAFLPHGMVGTSDAPAQPILLGDSEPAENEADVLFLVDGAVPDRWDHHKRICVLFDGGDDFALQHARALWRDAKGAGAEAAYWRQGADGAWSRQDS